MPSRDNVIKFAALLIALATFVVGIVGILSPDFAMDVRRSYFTQSGLYVGGAIRGAMGLVLILVASKSRWPWVMRAFGGAMCMQALSANLMGVEHARVVLEWEGLHPLLLLAGAAVALLSSGIIAIAVTTRPPEGPRSA